MKYCAHCGAELIDEAVICTKCGCWTNDQKKLSEISRPKLNVLALVGFILSIVSIVVFLFAIGIDPEADASLFIGIPFAIAGFVCSIIGLIKLKRNHQRGKGFAIAGIVVGAVVGIFWLFILMLSLYFVVLLYILLILIFIAV